MPIRTGVLLLTMTAFAAPAWAQAGSAGQDYAVPVVITVGEGLVTRAPDRAWVTLAAESRAKTPQEAQRANTTAMTAVVRQLKNSGLPADAIQTTGYDLQPEFDYQDGKQTLRDYVARNQVQVKVDALDKLGEILTAAVTTGATSVSGIRFDVRDRAEAEREALGRAVADAKGRAEAAAAGAGMKVDRVVRIDEQRAAPVPQPRTMAMAPMAARASAEAVPVEAGQIEIRAHVTLTAVVR